MRLDLFERCADCAHLGAALESGVRYCGAMMTWRWARERPACGLFTSAGRGGAECQFKDPAPRRRHEEQRQRTPEGAS